MDPRLILAVTPVDVAGSMSRGNQLAAETNALRTNNALQDVYRTQGANLLQGDQGALNALAQIDPGRALDLQGGVLQNRAETRRLEIMNAEEQRAIAAAKASMTAAEAQAAAQQIEDAVKMGLAIQTPEQWDAVMSQQAPELVGQFANRQPLAMKYMSMADALKAVAPPEAPKPLSPQAKFEADKAAGFLPPDAVFQSDAPNVTVNNGGGSDRQVFDAVAASAESARSAATGLRALQEAKAALDGGIISGAFADNVLALQKIGASLGVVDPTAIQNTETFRSAIAPQIAAMLKATVGSAQISNADREFAEKAAGGSISLDEGSIRRLVDIMERGSRAAVQGHMERLDQVYPDTPDGLYRRERALFGVRMPEASGASGSGSQGQNPDPAGSMPSPQPVAPLSPDLQAILDKYSTP